MRGYCLDARLRKPQGVRITYLDDGWAFSARTGSYLYTCHYQYRAVAQNKQAARKRRPQPCSLVAATYAESHGMPRLH